jgi:hypothetical protein
VDAAREGARAAARGGDAASVAAIVHRSAPDDASVRSVRDGEDVRVTVTVDVAPLGPVPLRVEVSAEAVARLEPGVEAGAG